MPGSLPAGANVAEVVNEYVEVDPKLFRTGEIHDLRGDATLAQRELKWKPEVDFKGLVRMMVESDTASAGKSKGANLQYARTGA